MHQDTYIYLYLFIQHPYLCTRLNYCGRPKNGPNILRGQSPPLKHAQQNRRQIVYSSIGGQIRLNSSVPLAREADVFVGPGMWQGLLNYGFLGCVIRSQNA